MKMQSIERIALLLLAIILAIWAVILLLRRDSVRQPDLSAVRADTIVVRDTVFVRPKPDKQRIRHDNRQPSQPETPPTNPLNVPVEQF